jgi:5-oxoprolinase (ATP-hydrolysing)
VETSQTIVNCSHGALGVLGSAQGTMNNLTFGNERYQYYETICSGAPAGPGFDGAPAVQTHMTNSRLTDPEVLELRYPVLLERFEIVRGSGGKGKWRAGDGTLRVIRFLERMECAILSGFRKVRPFGLLGGADGQPGENWVRRKTGGLERLKSSDQTLLEEGEAIIKTPTGGFGKSERRDGAALRRLQWIDLADLHDDGRMVMRGVGPKGVPRTCTSWPTNRLMPSKLPHRKSRCGSSPLPQRCPSRQNPSGRWGLAGR